MVPDTNDYTKIFGLLKRKGSKLDLNMMKCIHGKDWDTNLLEALISENIKPHIIKKRPRMQIGGISGNGVQIT